MKKTYEEQPVVGPNDKWEFSNSEEKEEEKSCIVELLVKDLKQKRAETVRKRQERRETAAREQQEWREAAARERRKRKEAAARESRKRKALSFVEHRLRPRGGEAKRPRRMRRKNVRMLEIGAVPAALLVLWEIEWSFSRNPCEQIKGQVVWIILCIVEMVCVVSRTRDVCVCVCVCVCVWNLGEAVGDIWNGAGQNFDVMI